MNWPEIPILSQSLISAKTQRAKLVGYRPLTRSPPATLLPVFVDVDSAESGRIFLYQQSDNDGRICGFVGDPAINAKHLIPLPSDIVPLVIGIGDDLIRAYAADDGRAIRGAGNTFKVALREEVAQRRIESPFAQLEIARFVEDAELEERAAISCAKLLARRAPSVARAWSSGLSCKPELSARINTQISSAEANREGHTLTYRTGLVAVLDVGSSKTVCLIARSGPGSLEVLGSALRETRGVDAGTVVDLTAAEDSIRDCVAAAENLAHSRIQNVLISVNCGSPTSVTSHAAMALDGALVTDNILRELLAEGRARCQLDGHVVIQSMPTNYVVDEAMGVRDPSGMYGQRIGVSMHAVAVKPTALTNLRLAIEHCHLNVAAAMFAPYASGLSVLTDDEKQLGATLIDMGGGCTSIAVFLEGHLVHSDVVPIGGQAVTADLARMLATPLSAAERAKVLYGAALGDLESNADVVSVPQMGEENDVAELRVPRSMLSRIIQARLEEIFGEVQKRLRESGCDVAAGRRLVLTGGASQLAGVRQLAARVLDKQARTGRPHSRFRLPASSTGPGYATAIGLLMAGATMPPEVLNPELDKKWPTGGVRTMLASAPRKLAQKLFGVRSTG